MPSASSPTAVFTPPPPGLNYVAALDPSIKFLLIGTACSATLIPLAIVLFYFSNSGFRRQPVFVLNVLMIALGRGEGAITIFNQTRATLAKPVPVGFLVAFACLEVLVPMVADTVLLVRVATVYPPNRMHSRACAVGIYMPMAAIKIARIIVETVFVVQWTREIIHHSHDNVFVAGQEAWDTPYPKSAWVLQLVDATYASMLFLLRLKPVNHRSNLSIPGFSNDTNTSESTKNSDTDRLKTPFWISASNFVFPVIFDLALLIIAFRDTSFLDGAYVLMASNYVDIIGVLLATIWSTSTKYPHAQPLFTVSRPVDGVRTARGQSSPRVAVATFAESPTDESDGVSVPMTVLSASTTGTIPSLST